MATDPDGKISILYVEDDSKTREHLSEIIGHLYPDVRLLLAENGAQGIASFRRNKPEIVLTDINMPITSGLKMAAGIKAMSPATEIIALTAHNNCNYLLEAIETGISHYILKPVDVKQIRKILDKALSAVRSERIIASQNQVILNLNAELTQKAADLEFANHELAAFNYTVAHDLRSPLVHIRGFSQILLTDYAPVLDEEGTRCLEVIITESTRMHSLIAALLKFSHHSQKNVLKRIANLTVIAQEIRDSLLSREPERQAAFSIAEGATGFCDPDLLRIVLENLFGNAWKFSARKDQVLIEFGTISREEDLVYFVRDNGAGFDMREAENLFVPFQRLQSGEGFEGLGIGLATVAKIIQRHGGRIWAEGEQGKGATFYFTL